MYDMCDTPCNNSAGSQWQVLYHQISHHSITNYHQIPHALQILKDYGNSKFLDQMAKCLHKTDVMA